jgi:hypothetical protein
MGRKKKPISKKAFVAGLPFSLPNADVITKGKQLGLNLSTHQVSNIRYALRKEMPAKPVATKGPKTRTRTTTSTVPTQKLHATNGAARPQQTTIIIPNEKREQLRAMALELGLFVIRAMLDDLETELRPSPNPQQHQPGQRPS